MASETIFTEFVGESANLTFWHGHSFTGNPLGCAAANASLDLLQDNPKQYENFESRHMPHLKKLTTHPKVQKIRLTGTIAAFDLKVDGPTGYLNSSGQILKAEAMKNEVFIRPLGNVVYLLPPLCISDAQLEKCYWAIHKGLEAI